MSKDTGVVAAESADQHWTRRFDVQLAWQFLKNRTPERVIYSLVFSFFLGIVLYGVAKLYGYLYMNWWGFYDYEFFDSLTPLYLALWQYLGVWLFLSAGYWIIPFYILKNANGAKWKISIAYAILAGLILINLYGAYKVPALAVPLLVPIAGLITTYFWLQDRLYRSVLIGMLSIAFLVVFSFLFQARVVDGYGVGLKRTNLAYDLADIVFKDALPDHYSFFPSKEANDRPRHIQAKVVLVTPNFIYVADTKPTKSGNKQIVSTATIPMESIQLLMTVKAQQN
jgi:hypothetical protein